MFQSKYNKKLKLEEKKEARIQQIQLDLSCDRKYAVNFMHFENEAYRQNRGKIASSVFFSGIGLSCLSKFNKVNPLTKTIPAKVATIGIGFYTGLVAWDKLIGHYFNWVDHDVSHNYQIDFGSRYGLKTVNPIKQPDFTLENNYEYTHENLIGKGVNQRDWQVTKQSKDKFELNGIKAKVRNIENMVFLKQEQIDACQTPEELQLLIDSINLKPTKLTTDQWVAQYHKMLEKNKYDIESRKYFRSEKERFLGLPFMKERHQQFPEPSLGTWQYDFYKQLFGEDYATNKYQDESEEKINIYNYQNFLHPSVINKYNNDINNPEFKNLIKQKFFELKTNHEQSKENREYFCKKILPNLNLINNEKLGKAYAHYVLNLERNQSNAVNHYYEQYSNQNEEKLFREAEESRFIDKSDYNVTHHMYSTIDKSKIGIRSSELNEILNNPNKDYKIAQALRTKYLHYSPLSKWALEKRKRNTNSFIDTVIDSNLDINDPEAINYSNLNEKTFDRPDLTEDSTAALDSYITPTSKATPKNYYDDEKNCPLGSYHFDSYHDSFSMKAYYFDYSDYEQDTPNHSYNSIKTNRYENASYLDYLRDQYRYGRKYPYLPHKPFEGYVVPHKERSNEEIGDKIFKRRPFEHTKDRAKLYKNELESMRDFVNFKVEQDSSVLCDDITEDELNQAIFEASYTKPVEESEEYKSKYIYLYIYNLYTIYRFGKEK